MAKMRANPKLEHKPGGFSCMGESYVPDADGWIDIPKPMVEIARAHGYISGDEFGVYTIGQQKVSHDLTVGMTRRQLIAYCVANDLDIPDNKASVESLRVYVTNHMAQDEAA